MKPVAEEMFHCSDYPTSHPLYSETNKKRVGCWKDENSSDSPMSEFVGLHAKLYSISSAKSNKIKAKGISKSYKIHKLRHETFLNVLRSKVPTNAKFYWFQSANHVLKTVLVDKPVFVSVRLQALYIAGWHSYISIRTLIAWRLTLY